ncbi:MAG TPA: MopE-related protein, partial [Myxococcota bacterium]|nr:MopE-related protein [Myxococcota bacterium]
GYVADATDCDDSRSSVYPSATETCNGVDDDCNGAVDDNVANATAWYTDADGDGYGDGGGVRACTQPSGAAALDGDCNDADPLFYPGAPELDCTDPNDYNCDGSTGAVDGDGDGYVACTDCDDTDSGPYPGAIEVCDGVDNDCNGLSDEAGALGESTWYADADGDGFGDASASQDACDAPPSFVADDTDCDDSTAAVNPNALEICDGLDNDCDGSTDVGAVNANTWYYDGDLDGYGDSSLSTTSCTQPSGYAAAAGDCNDADSAYNPGASETDCTDPNDYNCDGSTGFDDRDGDGFAACAECDDGNNAIFPGATEVCNGSDDDCDGQVDEAGATGERTWYYDGDADNYGDATSTLQSCSAPSGYAANGTDCNDGDATINPGAGEYCDGIDTNCDGSLDAGAVDATPWYDDVDADGYGSPSGATYSCSQPAGTVSNSSDCDDSRPAVNPAATEICDGLDNNCDAVVDTDAVDPSTWYRDADGDGYGTGAALTACDQPTGYGSLDGDCNDASTAYYPGAPEVCTDVVDYNCDGSIGAVDSDGDGYIACLECDDGNAAIYPGAIESCNGYDDDCDGTADESGALGELTWYYDGDGDGFGGTTTTRACTAPPSYVSNNTDCNDSRVSSYPGATESCNGFDDDCDGLVDEAGSVGETTWYYDADGDGFGGTTTVSSCNAPSGYVSVGGDCNDSGAGTNPNAPDICDVIDNDCDGSIDEGGYCPCSVQTYGGHPYQFCTSSSNWNDAAVACAASSGYTLATPTSSAENTWVVTTAFSYSSGRWWAGGYDSVIEGRWEWITGETWSYTNWASGEGSSQSQDCLQLGNTDYTWADASCRSSGSYVCEGIP